MGQRLRAHPNKCSDRRDDSRRFYTSIVTARRVVVVVAVARGCPILPNPADQRFSVIVHDPSDHPRLLDLTSFHALARRAPSLTHLCLCTVTWPYPPRQ